MKSMQQHNLRCLILFLIWYEVDPSVYEKLCKSLIVWARSEDTLYFLPQSGNKHFQAIVHLQYIAFGWQESVNLGVCNKEHEMGVFFSILALTQKQKVGLLNSQSLDLPQSCKNVESGHKTQTMSNL